VYHRLAALLFVGVMAKRGRRTSKRTAQTPAEDRGQFRRHPGVWLATLSTVVGVATGMFTLRDQVFPREAGTAAATSVSTYQREIGRVCDELNDNDDFRARDEKATNKRLQRVKTTIAQRNALLDAVRRTASRSAHALASLDALAPPTALAAVRRDTETAWRRHLARLRDYTLSLDRAGTRAQLDGALNQLAALQPAHARDSDKVRSGLERLGEANCDLEPQIVTPTFTLPPLKAKKGTSNRKDHTPDTPANGPPATSPAPSATPPTQPQVIPAPAPATGPSGAAPPANPTNPGPTNPVNPLGNPDAPEGSAG
jgi:hypothetical protein